MSRHDEFMRLALAEAARGRGAVEPNPQVGAVLVKDNTVIATGCHTAFGAPHAEAEAIRAAGDNAAASTLYVTLEPCAHHGKTPPCADAIVRAGIAEVVVAMDDPNPVTSGKGFEILRAAGIPVTRGVLEADARALNAPYLTLITEGRPYVTAKWAMTLDGKITASRGTSTWISGDESIDYVHRLRGTMDAVIVGSGTAGIDDPLLTARGKGPRVPARIVLDSRGSLSTESRLMRTLGKGPVIVAVASDAPEDALERLQTAGAQVLRTDLPARVDIRGLLKALGGRNMTNVLVEGGETVLASFFEGDLVDAARVFVCPRVFGGDAPGPVGGAGIDLPEKARTLQHITVSTLGDDTLIEGVFREPPAPKRTLDSRGAT